MASLQDPDFLGLFNTNAQKPSGKIKINGHLTLGPNNNTFTGIESGTLSTCLFELRKGLKAIEQFQNKNVVI